jgi:Mrp family chromosome partitioning ATPase
VTGAVTDGDGRARILLATTGAPYEDRLLAALGDPGSRLVVARRCLDLVDLLAAAATGLARYAVVWPDLHGFDREAVARLTAAEVVVCALAEGADAERLLDFGVAACVAPPVPPSPSCAATSGSDARDAAAVVRTLTATLRGLRLPGQPDRGTNADPGYALPPHPWSPASRRPTGAGLDPADETDEADEGDGTDEADEPPGLGRLVAVWGPVGAPGRTTVALTLADELANAGHAVVLADADTYGPSVAQRLGMLDESSGLAAAVRLASSGELSPPLLAGVARSLPSGIRVLTGLTRADRWPELRPASLGTVWQVARMACDVVVVDCGFCLEDDEELSFDSLAPRRNGAALLTLDQADTVVAVGVGEAVGMQRLVRGLLDLHDRRPGLDLRVVVTQVRRSAAGRDPGGQILRVLRRHAGADDTVLVPDDRAAFDLALAQARPLAEVAPRSPARAALRGLAHALAG